MSDPEKYNQTVADPQLKDAPPTAPLEGPSPYPAAIEKMSEKWREVQQQGRQQEGTPRNFVERNSLALGIGLALLIVALLVVIGGFAFLVWNAH